MILACDALCHRVLRSWFAIWFANFLPAHVRLPRQSGLPQSRVMCANDPKLGPTPIKQLEARISDYFPEYFNRDMTVPWLFGSPLLVNEEALKQIEMEQKQCGFSVSQ